MIVVFCLLVIRTSLIRRLESDRFGILWCNLVVQYWRCRIGVWCTRAILWCNLVVQYWRCRIGVWCTRAILWCNLVVQYWRCRIGVWCTRAILWCNLVVQYWRCRIGVWCTRAILSPPKQLHVHKGRAACYVIKVIIAPMLSLQKSASLFMVDWVWRASSPAIRFPKAQTDYLNRRPQNNWSVMDVWLSIMSLSRL